MIELGLPAEPELPELRELVERERVEGVGLVDDDAAFTAWYRNEHPRLLATMTLVTHDLHAAQDVTAEAFARALAAWTRVSAMDSPTGWTYRVALNLARRRGRRSALEQRVLRRLPPPDPGPPSEHAVEVWEAVRALPPRARTAIALRYAAGLSEAEVAAAMHIAVGTASATLATARRALALTLADPADADPPVAPSLADSGEGAHDG
jgi:RNA polymerase sigma factor (sigma-70 family)